MGSADYTPDGVLHVKLADGRTLALDDLAQLDGQLSSAGDYAPLPDGAEPRSGDLVLVGSKPSPWYAAAHYNPPGWYIRTPSGCYLLNGWATERADAVEFDDGLRLLKAADFDGRSSFGLGYRFDNGICLDSHGLVTALGPGFI